ncbi:MAG TPA: POTRA domain-containing protein [Candidatus Cybelea sp.]|nr:POTRA domain-containing protein [Candidatus Cybelea sp.]
MSCHFAVLEQSSRFSEVLRVLFNVFLFLSLLLLSAFSSRAQTPEPDATSPLREIHAEGEKILSEPQVLAITGLTPGAQIAKGDLQAAADKLVQSGLFAKVSYNFQTKAAGVLVTYHVEESPRVPVYFDNLPWFPDSALADAIRRRLPFFDGTLPEAGAAVDEAVDAMKELLTSRGVQGSLEHTVIASPNGEGNVQEIHIEGVAFQIAKLEFGDPSLTDSKAVQQHLSEILGKPYSRMAIDLFLSEAIKPIYIKQGFLRVKLGPPEVRLAGDPSQKLPLQIPVYVPVTKGEPYRWKEVHWAGNTLVSEFTLRGLLGLKNGDVADGMSIEAGWDRVREEYAHRGYLEAKLDPVPSFDDQAHTVSYATSIQEGLQYHFGKMVLTGISPAAERKLQAAWPIAAGAIFDKLKFEELLSKLQMHQEQVFGELPVHYDNVGHWLQTDASKNTVDVLLDFK